MKKFIYFSLLVFSLFSCEKTETQLEIDEQIIKEYIAENQIDAIRHESGMYYLITKEGTGDSPNINSIIQVNYKGYLCDGTVFDETSGTPYSSPLYKLILGWQIGIPMLTKGGEGTFFIPSELAYGNRVAGIIPANSVLIFEIELVDFQ